jgi:hypothetical protein
MRPSHLRHPERSSSQQPTHLLNCVRILGASDVRVQLQADDDCHLMKLPAHRARPKCARRQRQWCLTRGLRTSLEPQINH